MNHEQLAFFNQQLAALLRSGMPLESSLKELSANMKRGTLRDEVRLLEADLEQGVPIEEALGGRKLPDVYVAMLRAGVRGNDLPGVLTLAADYYGHLHATWLRLKGLLVYPAIVLATSLVVSTFLAVLYTRLVDDISLDFGNVWGGRRTGLVLLQIWAPVVLIGVTTACFTLVLSARRMRHAARWRLPGFREASLAQLASALAIMLEHGIDLGTALEVVQRNEVNVRVRSALAQWRQRLANGETKFAEVVKTTDVLPPLFVWLVAGAGENWARGFRRAADAYDARARYRIELALYAALPVTVLLVATLVAGEMVPLVQAFMKFMHTMANPDL